MNAGKWTLFFLCFLLASITYAEDKETVILTISEWPPYYGERLPHYGFDSHIVAESFAIHGVKVIYKFFPWTRAFYMAKRGDIVDGSVGWGNLSEYKKDFFISDPTLNYEIVFFHRKDFPFHWETFADLDGLRVGLTLIYEYPPELNQMVKRGRVKAHWAEHDALNFKMLLHGRIDIYPDAKWVGLFVANNIFTQEKANLITFHKTIVSENTLHLILSKKKSRNQRLITLFNDGLIKLKQSGKYDEILKSFNNAKYNIQK